MCLYRRIPPEDRALYKAMNIFVQEQKEEMQDSIKQMEVLQTWKVRKKLSSFLVEYLCLTSHGHCYNKQNYFCFIELMMYKVIAYNSVRMVYITLFLMFLAKKIK